MRAAVDKNIAAIEEGLAVLDRLRSLAEDDARAASVAAAGPHFRHCIDFYDCFLAGAPRRHIDYDARRRASEVETSADSAARELARLRHELEKLPTADLGQVVDVHADTLPSTSVPTRSTINRELLFLLSHTIHHYAIIAMLLRQQGVDLPSDFGFAPSTLEHAAHQD